MASDVRNSHELDTIDRQIIQELVNDSRISMRELAEKAHISRAHAYVRVERLKEVGIIDGFTSRIAYDKAGLRSSAYVALSIKQDSWRGLATQLRTSPFVEHFSLLGGEFDVLVLVRVPDNSTLRDVVLEQLRGLEGVLSTKTWLIFEEADGPGPEWIHTAP